jgi:predicted CXXCH cytochrome family protein
MTPAVETTIGSIPLIQDACLSCHDGGAAAAHAETNTTGTGAEACTVCHAEGAAFSVSEVHAIGP